MLSPDAEQPASLTLAERSQLWRVADRLFLLCGTLPDDPAYWRAPSSRAYVRDSADLAARIQEIRDSLAELAATAG